MLILFTSFQRGAELKIQHLMDRCKILESASNLIQTQVEKTVIESHDERHVDPKETLFVKVFFDGESCLSSIDLYWSFQLVNKSLYPMNSTSTNCELHMFLVVKMIMLCIIILE